MTTFAGVGKKSEEKDPENTLLLTIAELLGVVKERNKQIAYLESRVIKWIPVSKRLPEEGKDA